MQIYFAIYFAVLLSTAADLCAATGFGNLGYGYDIMRGDPERGAITGVRTATDPGNKEPVFELSKLVVRSKATSTVISDLSGLYVFSTSDFVSSLSLSILGDINLGGPSFSASASYQAVHKASGAALTQWVKVYQYAERVIHEIDESSVLSAQFVRDVNALPNDYNSSNNARAYENFVKAYGTHYVRKSTFGAKCILMASFSRYNLVCLDQETGNASIASAGNKFVEASISGDFSSSLAAQFDKRKTDVKKVSIGVASTDLSDCFAILTRGNEKDIKPEEININVNTIDYLLHPKFIPSILASTLNIKSLALFKYISSEHCPTLRQSGQIPADLSCTTQPTIPEDPLGMKCSAASSSWLGWLVISSLLSVYLK